MNREVAAETAAGTTPPDQEEYARSLSLLRRMGAPAVEACVDFEAAELVETVAFDNFKSALREMLKTDEEFRDVLDIDDKREYDVVDGMARNKEGVPMVEVVANGQEISEARAVWQPEFQAQAVRDKGDRIVAGRGDALKPGESLHALSMVPAGELKAHKDIYQDGLGYREGLSYWQWYSMTDEGTLVAGSFSIDMSDEATWREMFADLGVEVPEDESPNTWIQHTITAEMTAEEAEQFTKDVRHEYYERRGVTHERRSVSEYVAAQDELVRGYFDAYFPALAAAVYSGENNELLQGLAGAVLRTDVSKLKPGIRRQLVEVSNGREFDDELGKTMESVIRYAVVEELRKGLVAFVGDEQQAGRQASGLAVAEQQLNVSGMPAEALNNRMANNVESGVKAGRSYGGCAGQVELSVDDDGLNGGNNPQEVYGRGGGSGRERNKKTKINCIKCRQPTTLGEVEQKDKGTWRCPHCKYEIDVCTGDVKHGSESSKNASKPAVEKPAKAEPAPVISLEAKRHEEPVAAEQDIRPVDTVRQAA